MRVALVHDWLTAMRGGEKCLEVFCELYPQADLFTLVYCPEKISRTIRDMNIHASWLDRLPGIERAYRYFLPLFPRGIESFDLSSYDLVLSSSHCVAKGVFPHSALHIAYIHAPMRYVWDQHQAYFGADSALLPRFGMALCRRYLQTWDVRSAHRVDSFIANSNNVAEKIRMLYGRHATTIYPPVDLTRFYADSTPASYYLIVSALVPYKRIDLAIDAFDQLGLPLKIVGDGPLRAKLQRRAGPRIQFLGWVDDEVLTKLYACCRAVVFPGEEDFGIVAVEAQASGRPVIAFGKGGVLESVVGFDRAMPEAPFPTGIFFREPTPTSLAEAVRYFEQHSGVFEPARIRRHADRFSRVQFKNRIAEFVAEKLRQRTS